MSEYEKNLLCSKIGFNTQIHDEYYRTLANHPSDFVDLSELKMISLVSNVKFGQTLKTPQKSSHPFP